MLVGDRAARGRSGGNPGPRLQALDSTAPTSTTCLLHGFARELRIGAFENSPDRKVHARVILWRLTVAKLRRSNLEFLAANGFA